MSVRQPPVLFLMGPTCSGKTALAVELVRRRPRLAIINVDSALVYQGLDIGAARPEPEVLAVAPHRLLGFRDPAEPYSAADFREDALAEIRALHEQGRIPLLVGGTMLYFRTLLQGLATLPAADATVRAQLDARAAAEGWPALHAWLAEVDPETAARLKPNDQQRVQRALEVFLLTGEPLSAHHDRQATEGVGGSPAFPYNVKQFALLPSDRALLHARIETRFHAMLKAGLIEEVQRLAARGDLHPGLPAIRAVGYRQVWGYLAGEYDREEMVRRAIVATRQLAKRQLTWLRGWSGLIPLDPEHSLESLCESVFSTLQEPFYPEM